MVEVFQHAGADGRSDELLQCHAGRLVAHVRGIGQVVVPVHPREKLPHERGFKARAARGVEDDRLRVQAAQGGADARKGLVPGGFHIATRLGIEAQGMGQAAQRLEFVVGQLAQVLDRAAGEDIGVAGAPVQVPDRGLGAVLAELGQVRLGGLGPGAGGAHVAVGLVLAPQRVQHGGGRRLAHDDLADAFQRSPATGGTAVMGRVGILLRFGIGSLLAHGGPPATQARAVPAGRKARAIPGVPEDANYQSRLTRRAAACRAQPCGTGAASPCAISASRSLISGGR